MHFEANSNDKADVEATKMRDVLSNQIFSMPLFQGCYPPEIFDYAKKIGVSSELFTDSNRLDAISQKIDFIGYNYYQRNLTSLSTNKFELFSDAPLRSDLSYTDGNREIYPRGFEIALKRMASLAPDLDTYITENGADYREDGINDMARIAYLQAHFLVLSKLINEGVSIKGYYLWTLLDGFEWENGYIGKYGIFMIDKALNRVAKKSALWYKDIIASCGQSLNEVNNH